MKDPSINTAAPDVQQPFVVFKVADLMLGLRVGDVSRVIQRVALRKVPEMPPVIEGFIELAEELIPVLNFSYLLGLSAVSAYDSLKERVIQEQMIIAKIGAKKIAWRCEDGTKVIQGMQSAMIELPPDHVLNSCAKWHLLCPNEKAGIVILEPELLLLHEEEVRMNELAERLSERKSLASEGSVQG